MLVINRKIVSAVTLTLLLTSLLALAFNIQPVKASGTIYIGADGSVAPSTAPIQRDGEIYTLTGNITSDADGIVIDRNNIVIDGAGYAVQGTGVMLSRGSSDHLSRGIDLSGRSNVTIKNTQITAFYEAGIFLYESSNDSISGNDITANNVNGIELWHSSNNSVSGNGITANNGPGIWLDQSSNNSIVGNVFTNDGLEVYYSYGNIVGDNLVNGKPLVYLEDVSGFNIGSAGQVILINCDNINVEDLNLSHTDDGIQLWDTTNTKITRNNITANNEYGIGLSSSENNTIVGNNITANNEYGIGLWVSSNNSVSGNSITANNGLGIWLDSSSNNSIVGNSVTDNVDGIYLDVSDNNSIVGNSITDNAVGIYLDSCSDNVIYQNNFVDNIRQVYILTSYGPVYGSWDDGYPSGGNYWSDHNPPDADKDKIGNLPYAMDENNTDRYPLIYPFECYEPGYVCSPDLNKDGIVNIVDVAKVARAFTCKPGDTNWNPVADMDLNEVVNIVDVSRVAKEFGKEWKEETGS